MGQGHRANLIGWLGWKLPLAITLLTMADLRKDFELEELRISGSLSDKRHYRHELLPLNCSRGDG